MHSSSRFTPLLTSFLAAAAACSQVACAQSQPPNLSSRSFAFEPVNWPMYARDCRNSGYTPTAGPRSVSLKWQLDLGQTIPSLRHYPVVAPDNTVYLGFACSINPNGTLRWIRGDGNLETAAAVSESGAVYFIILDGVTYSLKSLDPKDGRTIWSYSILGSTYGSPIIGPDGTIYVSSTGTFKDRPRFIAVNPDGTKKWEWINTLNLCWLETTPAISSKNEIFVNANCSGLLRFSQLGEMTLIGMPGDAFNFPSIDLAGNVFLPENNDIRVQLATGKFFSSGSSSGWMYQTSATISPDGRRLYRGDNNGFIYAFSAPSGSRNGEIVWRRQISERSLWSRPVLAGNGILYSPAQTNIVALDADQGTLLWSYPIGRGDCGPALADDGTLYTVGQGTKGTTVVYALYEPTSIVWLAPRLTTNGLSSALILSRATSVLIEHSSDLVDWKQYLSIEARSGTNIVDLAIPSEEKSFFRARDGDGP